MAENGKQYFVYILTNRRNSVIYTGVTGNLRRRLSEHASFSGSHFTSRYKATKLVYYETHSTAYAAIVREKKIKGGSRKAKIRLVESLNPEWNDLAIEVMLL